MPRHCSECAYHLSVGSESKLRRRSRIYLFFRSVIRRLTNTSGIENASLFFFVLFLSLSHWQHGTSIFFQQASTVYSTHEGKVQTSALIPNHSFNQGPPAYLPLAQHLKNINVKKGKPSLEDMIYGSQKRTLPDLAPTFNRELFACNDCLKASKFITMNKIPSRRKLYLARHLFRIVAQYQIASILVFPCAHEAKWLLPTVKAIRVRI